MKKVNLTGKLSLNKETIAKLNDEQMNVIKGGTERPISVNWNCVLNTLRGCPATAGYTRCAACFA